MIVDLDVQPEAMSAQAIKGMFDDKGQRLSPTNPSGGRDHDAPQLDVGVGIAQARQQHEAREPILLNQRKGAPGRDRSVLADAAHVTSDDERGGLWVGLHGQHPIQILSTRLA